MLETIVAADPLLLSLYRQGGDVPKTLFIQVFEEGRAPISKPLCKAGFHRWVTTLENLTVFEAEFIGLSPRYAGFNLDRCRRRCRVSRLWRPMKGRTGA